MKEQMQIISEFQKKFNWPSLSYASELTGIQVTRVHRIFKGHELKLSEYLRFKEIVDEEEQPDIKNKIDTVVKQLYGSLSVNGLNKLHLALSRIQKVQEFKSPYRVLKV